jgi:hypothetical protein
MYPAPSPGVSEAVPIQIAAITRARMRASSFGNTPGVETAADLLRFFGGDH